MKKLQFTIATFLLLFTLQSNAQISVSLNIGSRPAWHNHHEETNYYYLPEIEAYYDVQSSMYIYLGSQGWIRSVYLPEYCQNYDINHGYRVAIDYRGNSPFAYFNNHREKYYRDCHRNYRAEYYRPNYEHRREYVVVENRNRNDNYYYKKEKRNNGKGHGYGRR